MEKIKITCDSTCDLGQELYDKYDIEVVPLHVIMGDKDLMDGIEVSPSEIFDFVSKTGVLPKTAARSVDEYMSVFSKYTDEGYSVIHISISSDMSSSHQNALIAAGELQNVYVIDSKNLSTGSGHLAVAAAELIKEGLTATEIVDKVNEMKERLDVSFVIDTLEYLHKGGRCSSVAALGANLLKLKPCILVKDGTMSVGKKYRGSLDKCLAEYIADKLKDRDDIKTNRIFITHTCLDDKYVELAKQEVQKYHQFDEILETRAGGTIASHCGPNTLGILFFKK